MFSRILVASTLLFSANAFAGAANAIIECKSSTGRTTIEANVPGDMSESAITLNVDGKKQSYIDQNMIDNLELNNVRAEAQYPGFKLTSIKTTKTKREINVLAYNDSGDKFDTIYLNLRSVGGLLRSRLSHGGVKIQFKAEVTGMDPRAEQMTELPKILVNCTWIYQI